MIREAVCMGIPAYDIFTGPMGMVEKKLIDAGIVKKINNENDFNLICKNKVKEELKKKGDTELLNFICDYVIGNNKT